MIQTSRTKIRNVKEYDLGLLLNWRNDPENQKYFLKDVRLTIEKQKDWFERINSNDKIEFFVFEFEEKIIGTISISNIDLTNSKAEIGNVLIGERTKRGIGLSTEIISAVTQYAFKKYRLNRIYLEVLSENNIAINAYERCGFVKEGVLRESQYKNNEYKDVTIMSMLKVNLKK